MRALAILPIVLLFALAGCADGPDATAPGGGSGGSSDASDSPGSGEGGDLLPVATVVVDHGDIRPDEEPTEDEVAFDPATRPSQERYDQTGTPRPDAYTVHDLMVDWSEQSGTQVTIEHHAAHGFRVTSIDGVTANNTPNGRWYWALHVDGEETTAPMGTVEVDDGTEVLWRFTHSTH